MDAFGIGSPVTEDPKKFGDNPSGLLFFFSDFFSFEFGLLD